MNKLIIPGKILFYGQYAILEKEFFGLSFAVLDNNKKGLSAVFSKGKRRIISKQFNLDFEPKDFDNLVSCAYLIAEHYLKYYNLWKWDISIKLKNSKMFGQGEFKSGLGSSAAAIVGTISSLFKAQGLDLVEHKQTILKLSEYSAAVFSKKLGSGYDIATSVYKKSIIYKRFSPNLFEIFDDNQKNLNQVILVVNKKWDFYIKPFEFPKDYKILFFNILNSSTQTTLAVKEFFRFKQSNPQIYFESLRNQNNAEKKAIFYLQRKNIEKVRYYTHIARQELNKLSNLVLSSSSNKNFVLVEPNELSNIINQAEKIDGVIVGRCPGAGGYDGLAFIVRNDFDKTSQIIKLAKKYKIFLKHQPLEVL